MRVAPGGVKDQIMQPGRGIDTEFIVQYSTAALVLAKGFAVVALAKMDHDKSPVGALPKRLGLNHGERGVDRLAIAPPLREP